MADFSKQSEHLDDTPRAKMESFGRELPIVVSLALFAMLIISCKKKLLSLPIPKWDHNSQFGLLMRNSILHLSHLTIGSLVAKNIVAASLIFVAASLRLPPLRYHRLFEM